MSTSILLIDLSSIAHAEWHANSNDPNPDMASQQTVARVRALASGQPHVAICIDSPPYDRKAIDPTYKANRPTEHQAVIGHQIAVAIDTLKADGFPVWGVKGYEADDIIATAVSKGLAWYTEDGETRESASLTIASADKDVLQLVSDRVTVKSLKDGSIIDSEAVKTKFGVVPNQIVDYLALVGDTSDNIVGAKGIGAKRAAALLAECGNLDDLYRAIDGGMGAEGELTPSMLTSLKEFRERMPVVRSLITLKADAPIPFDQVFKERVPQDVATFDGGGMDDERGSVLGEAGPPAEAPQAEAADRAVDAAQPAAVVRPDGPQAVQRDGSDRAHSGETRQAVMVPDVVSGPPVEWERQLEPRSMAQAKQASLDIAASRHYLNFATGPAVFATILAGRELGFPMMASLRAFHVIDGKPTLSAGAIHSLILASGKAEYFRCSERTAEKATFVTKRKGDPDAMSLTFTIAEGRQAWAKDEKAWNASGWGKNPADMLVARALTKLARLVYPDVTHGLYAPEEIG